MQLQSWGSLIDCVYFHLLTVFHNDAAETQCFYISNGLKKPNRVLIHQFISRLQQLNGYLELLPCLYYSNHATKLTTVVKPFNDTNLVSHILRLVSRNWQDQYKLSGATVPQSVRKLLESLECIKRPIQLIRIMEGTRLLQSPVTPPRRRWFCLRTKSQKRATPWVQSNAHYAKSMGACI